MVAFGIEEEFLLVDPASSEPRPVSPQLRALLAEQPTARFHVTPELLDCQIELNTEPCRSRVEAAGAVSAMRHALARAADRLGTQPAGVGVAFDTARAPAEVTDTKRYRSIQRNAPAVVADEYVTGLHIHAEVEDPELRIQVMNRCRPWIPTLTAMAANSPYWYGRDSGFATWRTILYRRWPIQGCPPVFADFADYQQRLRRLLESGVAADPGYVSWLLRPSANYPTLECRCADSQLSARDTLLVACLFRALVGTEMDAADDAPPPQPQPEHLDIALWQAARYGLDGDLINLETGCTVPAYEQLARLFEHVQDQLANSGDEDVVRAGLVRLRRDGNGAQRQRQAHEQGGLAAWQRLVRSEFTAPADED
ncbi:carboxylate-amine ligase [Arthrobacter crystallopoietes BAB-32]|uniref:Putative glutamate--cysteine ligase 2 n=1 Tax=Arthrobacter crystallopoietes BAB-32 TaxID=1246476 RepID=N1V6V9_9MICC|nr:glutamate--cysteine ligase [Arthrobacter crystallopoietes]EMY33993.1 carboxylate-amine ligase [Arthrobacter crystallopoietes BAB-32]